MIRHDHSRMQQQSEASIIKTVGQHDISCGLRQRAVSLGAERDEQSGIGGLIMRQTPPIFVLTRSRTHDRKDVERAPGPLGLGLTSSA